MSGYIKYPNETFFLHRMRLESVVEGILSTCEEFYKKYRCMPDCIAVNTKLTKAFIQEVRVNPAVQILCIPYEKIIWMHVPPWHTKMLPEAEWVIVTNSLLPGESCSL